MFKKLQRVAFRFKRRLFIEILNKSLYDGTLAIYLTFYCNNKCSYCSNNYNKPDFDGYSYKLRSVNEWANKINNLKRSVVFTGGEPFLYRHEGQGLIDLVNQIDRNIRVHIYSNLGINIIEYLKKLKRPIYMLISFHPFQTHLDIFLRNIDYLRDNKNINYVLHVVDAEENMLHPDVEILKKRDV